MFKCHVCGSSKAQDELVSEVFHVDGKPVLVENIPAQVCARCGEEIFSSETVDKLQKVIASKAKPKRMMQVAVFEFA